MKFSRNSKGNVEVIFEDDEDLLVLGSSLISSAVIMCADDLRLAQSLFNMAADVFEFGLSDPVLATNKNFLKTEKSARKVAVKVLVAAKAR